MLALYHSPISTCSQKVRLALAEKGLDYESRVINFGEQDHLSPEYLKINPNGVVPSLLDDGRPIIDSSVICEYLDERYPQGAALGPSDVYGRAQMRAWMRYFEEVPTVAIRVPSFNDVFVKFLKAAPEEDFQAMTERMPLRKHFYRQMGPKGFSDQTYDESIEKLRKSLERVDAAVKAGGPFILGDYSIADIVFIPSVVRMEDLGLAHLWSDLPGMTAWYAAVQARPSFDIAYMPGARIDPATFTRA